MAVDAGHRAEPDVDGEPFVGREAELTILRSAWDRARRGAGSVVAVSGEAGIGKTRLAEELADHVQATGGRVLWGRAEELAGVPPYWPWVEVVRELLTDAVELDERLAAPAAQASLLVPELRDRFSGTLDDSRPVDADRRRWLLLDGVSRLIWASAETRPIAVILDDLHWADGSTALLLQHFARGIRDRGVVLVLLYRGEAIASGHPLAATLGELNRHRWFERIEMTGLERRAVGAYLGARLHRVATEALIDSVMSRTEGNPFFLRELAGAAARSLDAAGAAVPGGDAAWLEASLPQGIREAAAASLGFVSEEARLVLTWAALLGEEFAVTELVAACELPHDDVLAALEASRRAGIVREDERTAGYRFAHALLRDALSADLSASQRARLHAQVAQRLEASADSSSTPTVDRLAYHYGRAAEADVALAPSALRYSKLAAHAASRISAWTEAAQHYERALALVRRDAALTEEEGPLLVELGAARLASGDSSAAHPSMREGIAILRRSGRSVEAAEATMRWLSWSPQYPTPEERRGAVTRALSELDDRHEALRARLLVELITTTDRADAGEALAEEARTLAQRNRLPDIEARLARWEAQRLYGRRQWDGYRETLLEASRKFAEAGDRGSAFSADGLAESILVFQGKFDEAVQSDTARVATADRIGNKAWATLLRVRIALMELQRGNRGSAVAALDAAPLGPEEHGAHGLTRAWIAELDGDLARARAILDAIPPGVTFPEAWLPAGRARLSLIEGDLDEVHRQLALWMPLFEFDRHQTPGCISMGLLEHAVTVPARERREELFEVAATWDGFHFGSYGGFDRVRGLLALSLDRIEEAERLFQAGRDWALRERCGAEAGRCELALSEVAERRGRHADAVRLARSAVDRLRAGGGVLDVATAERRLEQLHPGGAAAAGVDGLLTAREVEVLHLLAAGATNAQIAERLVISRHTVANHVKHILAKTGSANRTEAAAFALANGIASHDGAGR